MQGRLATLVVCGFIALSQHLASDGMWWRRESGVVSADECRTLLKQVTTRPRVGFTKWYDVTPQQLEKQFWHAATADKGTWLGCFPEGTEFAEPDA